METTDRVRLREREKSVYVRACVRVCVCNLGIITIKPASRMDMCKRQGSNRELKIKESLRDAISKAYGS